MLAIFRPIHRKIINSVIRPIRQPSPGKSKSTQVKNRKKSSAKNPRA